MASDVRPTDSRSRSSRGERRRISDPRWKPLSLSWPLALSLLGLLLSLGLIAYALRPKPKVENVAGTADRSSEDAALDPLFNSGDGQPRDLEIRSTQSVDSPEGTGTVGTGTVTGIDASGTGSAYLPNSNGAPIVAVAETTPRSPSGEKAGTPSTSGTTEKNRSTASGPAPSGEDAGSTTAEQAKAVAAKISAAKAEEEANATKAKKEGEEKARLAEENNKKEMARIAAEKKAVEEKAKAAAATKQKEEMARIAAEKKVAEEKAAEEKARLIAAAKQKEEDEKKRLEETKVAAAKAAQARKEAEQAKEKNRLAEMKRKAEEAAKMAAASDEEKARLIAEQKKQEEEAKRVAEVAEREARVRLSIAPKFVSDYIQSGASDDPVKAAAYFADEVDTYFNRTGVSRQSLLDDRKKYIVKFPKRSYKLIDAPRILPRKAEDPPERARVAATFGYSVSGADDNTYTGTSNVIVELQPREEGWEIVSVKEAPKDTP